MKYLKILLRKIKDQYVAYIGEKSLYKLAIFLSGVECGLNEARVEQPAFDCYFQRFVERKIEYHTSEHWSVILSRGKTEEESFDAFFSLLTEFWNWVEKEECLEQKYWHDKPGHIKVPALAHYPFIWTEEMNMHLKNLKERHWQIGEIYAHKITGKLALSKGITEGYLLVQIVDIHYENNSYIPIVYTKMANTLSLSLSTKDFEELEFIQTSYTRYEDRAWEVIYDSPEELNKRMNCNFKRDQYGLLPEYRARILDPLTEQSPLNWKKVGSVQDLKSPENEYLPQLKDNIMIIDSDCFEDTLIERYYENNLRELSIYH